MPIEGKTKRIVPILSRPGFAAVVSKDDITAGDGARRDFMVGKAKLANDTTCNVFEALSLFGIPLAFAERQGSVFITQLVEMIPVEIVVRNVAAGSYCKRKPDVAVGTRFDFPAVEFFFKTNDQLFRGNHLGCNDPLMTFTDDGSRLAFHHPGRPVDHERPMLEMDWKTMSVNKRRQLHGQLKLCKILALDVNAALQFLWKDVGGDVVDFKIECGYTTDGTITKIMVADVIDCDSWRVTHSGKELSKQPFRDGMSAADLLPTYQKAAELTKKFPEIARSLISSH